MGVKETLTRMKEHEIENVRGSQWSQLVLQPNDIDSIKKEMVTYFIYSFAHSLTYSLIYSLAH